MSITGSLGDIKMSVITKKAITKIQVVFILLIVVVVAVGGFYFSTIISPVSPPEKKILTCVATGDPQMLDPGWTRSTKDYVFVETVYERLVTYGVERHEGELIRTDEFEPALATSWEISEDKMVYTFHLREGVKFSNGNPFNAEAVRYSFNRVMIMKSTFSHFLTLVMDLDSTKVIDDYRVQITLNSPCPHFLRILRQPVCSIVDPVTVEAHGGVQEGRNDWMLTNMVGTGAYILKEWIPDYHIILEANKDYWRGPPKIDEIVVKTVKEPSTIRLLLEKGEIDVVLTAGALLWKDIKELEDQEGIQVQQIWPWGEIRSLVLNTAYAPLNNTKVRQALAYATDYEGIISTVLYGYAEQLKSPLPASYPYSNSSSWNYEYNPDKAKQLLAEAGYPDGFKITIGYPTPELEREMVATLVQANWLAIGLDVSIEGGSWAFFLSKLYGEDPNTLVTTVKYGPQPDPSMLLYTLYHSSQVGEYGNYAYYKNPNIDALIEEVATTFDEGRKREIYDEIQRILNEDLPWLPLYSPMRAFPLRSVVKDFAIPSAIETYAETMFYADIIE